MERKPSEFAEDFPAEDAPEEEAPEGVEAAENEGMPPPDAGQAMDAPEGAPDEDGEIPNVSPEEQALYDKFVDNAYKAIYSPKAFEGVVDGLKQGDDRILALATMTVVIVSRVEDDYESKTNKQVPGDIILHAGKEILEDLADLAQTEQIHDYTPEELEGAAYVAADLYREKRGSEGKLDEKAAKEEAGLLVKADQTGQMDELIPGASTAFAKKGPPQDAPEEEAPVEEDEE